MFSKFTEEARKVLIEAKKEMSELNHSYVGSEHLLLAILKNKNSDISKKLKCYNLKYSTFKKEIIDIIGVGKEKPEWFLYTPLLKKVIEDAVIESRELNSDVTVEMLFNSLIQEGEGIAIRILISMGIDLDEIIEQFSSKDRKKKKSKKKMLIDEYGYDMNKKALNNELDPVVGREEEIGRLIEILCRRTKNNPLLIGDAGVGKTAIIEELSRRISIGNIPTQLKGKRIVSLSMASLVSGTKYRGEFEERVNKIMKELENDNQVIIFIDEIHTLVGAGGAEGAIDASNILKPVLARGKIKVIGATTIEEYKKYIEDDKALSRRFQTIYIEEPNMQKTKEILLRLKPIYESFHNVSISDEVLDLIVELSNKYIYNRKQPDKAIDILDEVSSKKSISIDKNFDILKKLKEEINIVIENKNKAVISQDFVEASKLRKKEYLLESKINKCEEKINSKKFASKVTKDMVAEAIKLKTKIPVYELDKESPKKMIKNKNELLKRVYGQEDAVNIFYQMNKKVRLGFKDSNKPISLLLVGPTGVGKTLLVKEFTKLFIGDNSLITLDMSEYKEEHSISKIIGAPPGYVGYSNKNTVVEQIKDKPYSVILIDEIEKAHPSVVNLFLQILDEGRIKDSKGNEIRLDNNYIIMTSNIGFNHNVVGFNNAKHDLVQTKLKEFLSPEIMNRIDEVVIFNKLNENNIKEIVNKKVREIKKKYKEKGIIVNFTNKVINEIVKECKYEEYGARKVDKIISKKLDNIIIDEILNGTKKINIQTIH